MGSLVVETWDELSEHGYRHQSRLKFRAALLCVNGAANTRVNRVAAPHHAGCAP